MVVIGQSPDGVKVVREHDEGIDLEWMASNRAAQRLAEEFYVVRTAKKRFAVVGHDGEEVGCAIDFCAAVVHGGRTINDNMR